MGIKFQTVSRLAGSAVLALFAANAVPFPGGQVVAIEKPMGGVKILPAMMPRPDDLDLRTRVNRHGDVYEVTIAASATGESIR